MKAVILLSGGLDSTVVLALALEKQRDCLALSFDYGQRHRVELLHAEEIARFYSVEHRVITIDPSAFAGSSLTGSEAVPKKRSADEIAASGIPSTYVPARNTLFLAFATGQAELFGAAEIHAGPNVLDQNPYPDCRPAFYQAFQQVVNLATKQAVDGSPPQLVTPLISLDKSQIVQEGNRLGAPLKKTFSCYDPTSAGAPCGSCDACGLRREAGL